MIRWSYVLWIGAATVAAAVLFQVKHEVQALETRLVAAHKRLLADQEAIHVLEAEWSHLNQPGRVADLASRHLGLAPLPPDHITGFVSLPPRPEDFGRVAPAAGELPPAPQRRPATPAGWTPPARPAALPVSPPVSPRAAAAPPAPSQGPRNPVTGRPLTDARARLIAAEGSR